MKETLLFILIMAVIVFAILFIVYVADKMKCEEISADMGYANRYSMISGCRIKTPEGWIPLSNYRQEERR